MKSKMVRIVSTALALVMLLTLAAGCAPKEGPTPTLAPTIEETPEPSPTTAPEPTKPPTEEKRIVYEPSGDVGIPNPYAQGPRGKAYSVTAFIFENLVYADENGIIPWLAEDWEVSDGGLTYTLNLRDDVKWHDGEKFTANDVVFTFNYLKKHKNPLYDASSVKGSRVLSDYLVELILVQPMASFVSEVLLNIPIMPKHIWEKVDDPLKFHTQDWDASLIGTGPYMLKEYKTEHGSYLWVANPDYWWGQPAVDEIRMVKVEHSEVALLKGDIDCTQVGPKEIDMFKGKSEFTIVESIPYKFHWVTFDLNRDSAVASKDFRKAVAHAIDKQEFLDRFGHGFGNTCRQGGIAKTHPYFNGNVIEYEYDQAKAKAILDNLGYKDIDGDGFRENPDGTPMVLSMLVGSARQAELVAFKMEEIGVKVDIETVDSMALMKHFRQGAKGYDTYYNGGGHLWLARDPDFLRHNFHPEAHARVLSFHAVGFNNEEFNELATEQLRTLDDTKRRQLLDRMQEIVADELPIFYIYAKNHYFVFNNTVHDGWMHPYNHGRYDFSKLSYLREHSEHEPVTIEE